MNVYDSFHLEFLNLILGSGGYDLPENQKYEIKKLVEEGVKNSMYFVWVQGSRFCLLMLSTYFFLILTFHVDA